MKIRSVIIVMLSLLAGFVFLTALAAAMARVAYECVEAAPTAKIDKKIQAWKGAFQIHVYTEPIEHIGTTQEEMKERAEKGCWDIAYDPPYASRTGFVEVHFWGMSVAAVLF